MPLFFSGYTEAGWGKHRNFLVEFTTSVETRVQKLWRGAGGFTISNSKTTRLHCLQRLQAGTSTNIAATFLDFNSSDDAST